MVLLILTILLFLTYSWLIFYYYQAWRAIPDYVPPASAARVFISVIIPARNEEGNIGVLLECLGKQSYPRTQFEVIVVDDHSTDHTASIVRAVNGVTLVSLSDEPGNSQKKRAIETGIASAKGELIVTTDADCVVPVSWLSTLASFYETKKAVFIAGPVAYSGGSNVLERFQVLDFLTLQGITGASVYKGLHAMCNGANLAYTREAFYQVQGFRDIDQIASGDDMLLMYKIWKAYPDRIFYLRSVEALVSTRPATTWKEFINQRIRWASKASRYEDKRIFGVLLLVYLFNLCFPALLVGGFLSPIFWAYLILLLLAKTAIEYPFVRTVSLFFQKQHLLKHFIFFQPLHIGYTLLAGWLGQFGKYEWKGRRVR